MKITHDFHIHTYLSLCAPDSTGTVQNYIKSAKKQGLTKLGFANHFWGTEPLEREYYKNTRMSNHRLNPVMFYETQNFEHISQLIPELNKVKEDDINLYFGAECEYDPLRKSIAVKKEQAETLDFLIVPNSHTHMMMPKSFYEPYEKHIQFMFDAFYDIINSEFSSYITAVAHPFNATACPYDRRILNALITDDEYKRAFDMAANKGIAMEFNVDNLSNQGHWGVSEYSEDIRMMRIAKNCGCKIIFGSDAHSISEHENYSDCSKIADILELTEDDIAKIAR